MCSSCSAKFPVLRDCNLAGGFMMFVPPFFLHIRPIFPRYLPWFDSSSTYIRVIVLRKATLITCMFVPFFALLAYYRSWRASNKKVQANNGIALQKTFRAREKKRELFFSPQSSSLTLRSVGWSTRESFPENYVSGKSLARLDDCRRRRTEKKETTLHVKTAATRFCRAWNNVISFFF